MLRLQKQGAPAGAQGRGSGPVRRECGGTSVLRSKTLESGKFTLLDSSENKGAPAGTQRSGSSGEQKLTKRGAAW